jgi:hypothetical protein
MKFAARTLAVALTLVGFVSCASADGIIIENSPGGVIELAKSGDVVIDGPYLSACTLALGNHLFIT